VRNETVKEEGNAGMRVVKVEVGEEVKVEVRCRWRRRCRWRYQMQQRATAAKRRGTHLGVEEGQQGQGRRADAFEVA
jgi:hypothetical protein